MLSIYDLDLPQDGTSYREHLSPFRFIRHGNARFRIDALLEIGLTISLNNRFTVDRLCARGYARLTPSFGALTVITPGEKIDASIYGHCQALQMSLSLACIERHAMADFEIARENLSLRPVINQIDRTALFLLSRGISSPETEDESTISLIGHLVHTYNSVKINRSAKRNLRGGLSAVRVRRVKDFIESNLAAANLTSIAAEAALSPYHFIREFHCSVGQTPLQYLTQRRLHSAIQLFCENKEPMDMIALQSGFASRHHMARVMRNHLGGSSRRLRDILSR